MKTKMEQSGQKIKEMGGGRGPLREREREGRRIDCFIKLFVGKEKRGRW